MPKVKVIIINPYIFIVLYISIVFCDEVANALYLVRLFDVHLTFRTCVSFYQVIAQLAHGVISTAI